MFPHGRLLLAALVFSASLGVLVAVAAFLLGFLEASGILGPRIDDSPLHAVSFLSFVVAPALAVLSLGISVPASYLVWKVRSVRFTLVAGVAAAGSYALVAPVFLPGSSLLATVTAGTILAVAATASAYLWALSFPRSNKSLERTREG